MNGGRTEKTALARLTSGWGSRSEVSLYLDRCQVDTPVELVSATWRHVQQYRPKIGKVVDFGAGDGRFSKFGRYTQYVGYEIDGVRCREAQLSPNAQLVNKCAFSETIVDADLCIGNPPFVRNQDLPVGWRQKVSRTLEKRAGISISGLANAWQYFFLLSLASLKKDGLCALVIPYEWVSRPSARVVRDFVRDQGWNVAVYRLTDSTFDSVLTTSSITIVDTAKRESKWTYHEETADGRYSLLPSPSGAIEGVLPYVSRRKNGANEPKAVRGLSPGTQKVLTLTEGERVRFGLHIDGDVVPCVTTLRPLPSGVADLTAKAFQTYYRDQGQKCWLIRTDKKPSSRLNAYLSAVPETDYQTSTCLEREEWWKFNMPPIPSVMIATSFKGTFPKMATNSIGARAVGGVCGIYNVSQARSKDIVRSLERLDIRDRVVAHSHGLRKLEVNQLNSLLASAIR